MAAAIRGARKSDKRARLLAHLARRAEAPGLEHERSRALALRELVKHGYSLRRAQELVRELERAYVAGGGYLPAGMTLARLLELGVPRDEAERRVLRREHARLSSLGPDGIADPFLQVRARELGRARSRYLAALHALMRAGRSEPAARRLLQRRPELVRRPELAGPPRRPRAAGGARGADALPSPAAHK